MRASLVGLLLTVVSAVYPQPHPLVGRWTLAVANAEPVPGVGVEAVEREGSLVVSQVGDSLIGELTLGSPPGYPPREPQRLAGLARGSSLALSAQVASRLMTADRQMREIVADLRLELTLSGDSLSGELVRSIDGTVANPRIPVTGSRRPK